jgi:glucose dehydrogenase
MSSSKVIKNDNLRQEAQAYGCRPPAIKLIRSEAVRPDMTRTQATQRVQKHVKTAPARHYEMTCPSSSEKKERIVATSSATEISNQEKEMVRRELQLKNSSIV